MKSVICFIIFLQLLINFSPLFCDIEKSKDVKITKTVLNFPVNHNDDMVKIEILMPGDGYRSFDINLALSDPQYWVFMDVSEWIGSTAKISVRNYDGLHSGLGKIYQANEIAGQDSLYREKLRPQFHFTSKRGWNNDPNGLVYYDGEYHLYYQHNPYSVYWGNMHWGHAVSTDLIHWKELHKALYPDELGTMFSGSAVVDWNNTAGFQTDKDKVIVAAYTAHKELEEDGVLEVQCIAFSNDKGRTFTKYEKNPVIGDRRDKWNSSNIRDPKVFWYEPGQHWVLVLFEQVGNSIYTSYNLKDWTYQSHIEGFWECPELFECSVDDDPNLTKWVMYGASGSYLIGEFDGKTFTPESGKHWYHDGALYAAQTYNDSPESDGRRIQIAWGRIKSPGMPFNQMMLFPTEFSLRTTNKGVRLFCEPINEIEKLHVKKYKWQNLSSDQINKQLKKVNGDVLHIICELESITIPQFGIEIHGNRLKYDMNGNKFNDFPYSLAPNSKSLYMEILVDRTSIETFLDHGAFCSVRARNLDVKEKGIRIFPGAARGGVLVRRMELYELKSIWE